MRSNHYRGTFASRCLFLAGGLGVALLGGIPEAHATDPSRLWSTYYGGAGDDVTLDVCFDSADAIVTVGHTSSTSGIAGNAPGFTTFDSIYNGGDNDGYVAKFDFSGSRQWGTYYGGTQDDSFVSMAIDPSDSVIAFGITQSSGIGTVGDTTIDQSDGLLAKFDEDGGLDWARYVGGNGIEHGLGVCVASTGTIYVVGSTTSTTGLAASANHQGTLAGTQNAFIAKITGSGSLVWANYYGGSTGLTRAHDCVVDANHNIYVVGETSASDGIASNGWDNTYAGGGADAFLAKFTTNGVLVRATYYGGTSVDAAYAVDLDDSGNVYIAGRTASANGSNIIATNGTSRTGVSDAFVARFHETQFNFVRDWGTYFGGSSLVGTNFDTFYDLEVEGAAILLSGETSSSTGIATPDGFQTAFGGNLDAMFVAMDASDGDVFYATYIGSTGSGNDSGHGVAGTFGHAVVSGSVNAGGLGTVGAWDETYNAGIDGLVFLFRMFAT